MYIQFGESQSQKAKKHIEATLRFIQQRPGISEDRLGTLLECPIGPESTDVQRNAFNEKVRKAVNWLAEQGHIEIDDNPIHQYRRLRPVTSSAESEEETIDPSQTQADCPPPSSTEQEAIDPDRPLWNGEPVAKGSVQERVLLALRQIEAGEARPTLTNACEMAGVPTGSLYKRHYAAIRPYLQQEIRRIKAERNGSNGRQAPGPVTIASSQPQSDPKPDLTAAIDELQTQIDALSQRNQELEERNQTLRRQLGEAIDQAKPMSFADGLRQEAVFWRNATTRLTKELVELQADLDAAKRNYEAAERLISLHEGEEPETGGSNVIHLPPSDIAS